MERMPSRPLQNFDDPKTDILKKRLLKSANTSLTVSSPQNKAQHNVLMNALRPPISSSMSVSSVQKSQTSISLNNLVTHSVAPVKIHTSNSSYPLHLSTVHVPVQIPGSTSNMNVPVHLSGSVNSVPLQIAAPTVSVPLQASCANTSVPVQLPAGDTINVPLQLPPGSQNIQLSSSVLPSMPLLHNPAQPMHNSIIQFHMGSNSRGMDANSDLSGSNASQMQIPETNNTVQVKMSTSNGTSVQVNPTVVQIPNSVNNSIQLQLPSTGASGTVQLRGTARAVPHVVYIQTPTGLKPVTSTDVISQASTSGNPPQIIVRRPVTSAPGLQLISNVNKTNIAPKVSIQNKSSILAPINASQPIVIQKPKDKVIVPVSIAGSAGKSSITYLGTMKKSNSSKLSESQSILIPNNQLSSKVNAPGNQKLFITPMHMPKMQNTKFILPVTLPATMASKGPIINLQIANGQLQNDHQGNITVMRDAPSMENAEMPPLQPLGKAMSAMNGKDTNMANIAVPPSPKSDKTFTLSIPGSRAEPTGEQEYSLSIPDTNASMNDDIYTVSIADEDGGQAQEKSFTLAIPEKSKSLLNRNFNIVEREPTSVTIPAPAILRRSNSDNSEKKAANDNIKRRVSLCAENNMMFNRNIRLSIPVHKIIDLEDKQCIPDHNDDHRVPSLFCDEKLDKDLLSKVNMEESDPEDRKESARSETHANKNHENYQNNYKSDKEYIKRESSSRVKRESSDSTVEEEPPGLLWNNGVAVLQGSNIHFQTNEFGLIDIVDKSDHKDNFLLNPTAKYQTPLKQRIERSSRDKKPTSPEDLYRCEGCGCHGMAAEFITPDFCSSTCQSDVQKTAQKKRDRERVEVVKKMKKIKKSLVRKQNTDSDLSHEKDDKIVQKHNDALQTESRLSTDVVENEKYPWMCGKNGFSWMRYLDHCKAKAAPVKLFKCPFPYTKNGFKVGMRVEAIDPSHPSLFCVVSVAEVQGYRMRLHFDEYPDMYDYWVNADCIDIFPPGWCEKNGRTLKPPSNCSPSSFNWPLYLKQMKAVAAPRHLFPHICNTMVKPNGFRINMKLEAEDRKNNLYCVATVADMMDNRILINFDSWDEMYDYWVDPTSPYIHPVGWADENHFSLTPPNFYKEPESFTWKRYLSETGAAAAPARAFKTRAPHGFRVGMKLEVVDKRVPFLIRVATVSAVKRHSVQISFDGWPEDLSYWLDDDSPDIHPVGWCLKTGHPLEPPLTEEESSRRGPCGVGGCRGLGSLHGGAHKTHAAASTCPYRVSVRPPRADRLARDSLPPRALPRPRRAPLTPPPPCATPTKRAREQDGEAEMEAQGEGEKRWRRDRDREHVEAEVMRDEEEAPPSQRRLGAARGPALSPLLERLALPPEPTDWTESEVSSLALAVCGAEAGAQAARAVMAARLRGADLLMASCEELAQGLRLRLGPAIKLHATAARLRHRCAPTTV